MTQKPNNPVVQQVDVTREDTKAARDLMLKVAACDPDSVGDVIVMALAAHRQATLEEAAKVALFDRSELEPFVSAAAVIWCGKKERETFVEDIAYFKHNWSSLPGLRAEVVATAILSMEKAS